MPRRVVKRRQGRHPRAGSSQNRATTNTPGPSLRAAPAGIVRADASRLGLTDLPAELRNAIYEYALRPANGGAIRLSGGRAVRVDLALGLLGSCKAVRKEASNILFGQVPFRFDMRRRTADEDNSMRWPKSISVGTSDEELPHLHPEMHRTLGTMGPKFVSKIRSFLFVYHNEAPPGSFDSYVSIADMPEVGDLAWRLDLVRKAPFCVFAVDRRYGHRDLEILERNDEFEHFERFIVATIQHRCLQSLARRDILCFAESIRPSAERAVGQS